MIRYFNKFTNHAAYEAVKTSLEKPNVSMCEQEEDVHYNPIIPHDYIQDYLTFVALEDGTFTFSKNALQYSLDGGSNWTTLASNTASPTVTSGNKILWKRTGLVGESETGIGTFSSTGRFNVEGNIMSLYYEDNFQNQTDLSEKGYAFVSLFNGNTNLISAENLVLPATTLTSYCYANMFLECTSLTTEPQLPATTLSDFCYDNMFGGCTNLTVAPQLPATTLANGCYQYMFLGCTNLTTAPQLPATTLSDFCYSAMFQGCTNLTTAPELPATRLAATCYRYMFSGCTSLTTASNLPATTLANGCYLHMFNGCTSLTVAPQLPATTLTSSCYSSMFRGCTSLTTAPQLPATTLANYCYRYMFSGCTNLNSITCLATDISASNCTNVWVNGVSSVGEFVKAASMTSWTTGNDGIPTSWTVVDVS